MKILWKHSDLWSERLETIKATYHTIDRKEVTGPFRQQPYHAVQKCWEVLWGHVDNQLEAEILKRAQSEWASPIVLVPRKDSTLHYCLDYRSINAVITPDAYLLPGVKHFIDSFEEAHQTTVLDALWVYWQMAIKDENLDKTTFTTHLGVYLYICIPFDLHNAPTTFQHASSIIFSGV